MSVKGVAEKVAELVEKSEHEFIMCNFAPPDMVSVHLQHIFPSLLIVFFIQVGHTGVYDAAVIAITHTDEAVGIVYKACQKAGYVLLITADHGNAEQMKNPETGDPHTAHTTNKVPFIMTGDPKVLSFVEDKDKKKDEEDGALCDVAPTVLDIMGLKKPEGM
jgi:2,3-bisphosphoglycerate-independent phosphoglycerate mutase